MNDEPCTKLGAKLSGYHDRMLDDASRLEVEAHLPNCPTCRGRLAEYARVDRAVHALGTPLFEDRLREDLVAYARATIEDRGRAGRRQRQWADLRSWRTLVPLAAAAGVAILVLRLSDGGLGTLTMRRDPASSTLDYFESQSKLRGESDSQANASGSSGQSPLAGAPQGVSELKRDQAMRDRGEPGLPLERSPVPPIDAKQQEAAAPSNPAAAADVQRLAEKSAGNAPAQVPESFQGAREDAASGAAPRSWGGLQAQSTPSTAPLAKSEPEVAAESAPPAAREEAKEKKDESPAAARAAAPPAVATSPPPPAPAKAAARGHLDPQAALSIAALALEVGDFTGARLAIQDLPTLPVDSLTVRAAVLALTLAERSESLADCRAARTRADALVEAAPSGALADTLRVRRAALPCPH